MGCFTCRNIAKCSSIVALVFAVIIGLFVSGVPSSIGLFRWFAHIDLDPRHAKFVGFAPAFMLPDEYRYSFEDVTRTDLTGQTAVVTGANSGIGYWASLHLARQGATVIMACRTPHKCDSAAARIRANFSTADVTTLMIDTSKLRTVRHFAVECGQVLGKRPLDMLFLNAGIASAGRDDEGNYPLSEDNIEMVFATNHVGHHLLYHLLEPTLQASPMARVVLTSSAANYNPPRYGVATDIKTLNRPPKDVQDSDPFITYSQSKLAQILFTQELTRRLPTNSNIYVNSFHPGAVDTGLWAKIPILPGPVKWFIQKMQDGFFWSGEEGSLTMLYLGIATDSLEKGNVRGQYFHPQAVRVEPHPKAKDLTLQKEVWEFTERLVAQ